jgi:hypothetical protein
LEIQFPLQSSDFGEWLVLSSAFHYLLFDLMAGTGALNMSDFPEAIRGAPIFKEMTKIGMAELCGCSI